MFKSFAVTEFEKALKIQNRAYEHIDIRPSPLNSILWNANITTKNTFLLDSYSLFDTRAITFKAYPKNHELLDKLKENEK